jgi:hypothetical protein
MLRNAARYLILASVVVIFAAAGTRASAQSAAQLPAKSKAPAPRSQTTQSQSAQPQPNQKTFPSPQEAASALYSAARSNDENALLAILGPDSRDIVLWTDNAEDRKAETDQFAKKYDQMHRLVKEPDGETTLYVGPENWPLPIPIVQVHGVWYFDTALGKQEIVYRRIGENEIETIDVLRAIVEAQKEYYSKAPPGDGAHVYAAQFDSSQGARDGLYWPSAANDSPLGPYLARASYSRSDRVPLHGYYFRILTAQGANASGGSKSYIANGKMTGGFAVVAFPAQYRASGVKTFIVNQDGIVYERDLGQMTTQLVATMKAYNPDSTWHKAP